MSVGLWLCAWSLLAQGPPAGGDQGAAAPRVEVVRARVLALSAAGALRPAGGALVRLERRRRPPPGEMGAAEVVMAWEARAGGDGLARFDAVPPLGVAEADALVVRWRGSESEHGLAAPDDGRAAPVSLIAYETSRDLGALKMGVRLTVTPRDSGLQVEHLIQIENRSHTKIDTDQGAGLVVPLLTPAPFDAPVPSFLPNRPEPREFLTQQSPESGRLLVERGRLVFRGLISPDGQTIRVVYVIPYDGQTAHTYGLRLPVAASSVAMVARTSELSRPTISFRQPSEVVVRAFLGGEERTALLIAEPDAGEVVLIDVVGTPDRHILMRPLAAGLGALVVVALVVLALGRRRAREGA